MRQALKVFSDRPLMASVTMAVLIWNTASMNVRRSCKTHGKSDHLRKSKLPKNLAQLFKVALVLVFHVIRHGLFVPLGLLKDYGN